jgi:hypothetical protein
VIYIQRTKDNVLYEDIEVDYEVTASSNIKKKYDIDDAPEIDIDSQATILEDVKNYDKDGNELEGFAFRKGEKIELTDEELSKARDDHYQQAVDNYEY